MKNLNTATLIENICFLPLNSFKTFRFTSVFNCFKIIQNCNSIPILYLLKELNVRDMLETLNQENYHLHITILRM